MYAVIDIGSNSMRLVLYKLADGEPRQMLNSKQPAGLAGYIDKEQQLTPRGVQKAVEVLQRFQAILDSVHPKRVMCLPPPLCAISSTPRRCWRRFGGFAALRSGSSPARRRPFSTISAPCEP